MKREFLLFFGLGLILCMICAGCSPSLKSGNGVVTIDVTSLPAGTVGSVYSYSMPANGGTPPYVWSLGAGTLPAGLSLSSKGAIYGTPVAAGNTSFTVEVVDSEAVPASTAANLSISIQSELAVTSLSPPAGTVGVSYSTTLAATGGTPPYNWALANGALPAGLSLSSGGVISGVPTAGGAGVFTVQVADAESSPQTAVATLTINVSLIAITTQVLPAATLNVPYNAQLAATGGTAPYTWTLSGTLPAGLSLTSAGAIAGTPTVSGTSNFGVQATDSEPSPASASTQLSLTVNSSGNTGTLQGNYAFFLNGFDKNGPWTLAGSFIADGVGNVTSGIVDGNAVSGQPINTTLTGIYGITEAGLNTVTLQGPSWGPMTFAFVLDSSGNGRMIEYDDQTGQGSRGSGLLRKANSNAFYLQTLNGGWAFGMTGADPAAERFVDAGQFDVTGGSISSGACDTNDDGLYQTSTFTGTLSSVDPLTGRATATFQSASGTSQLAVYVVSNRELVMEEIDPVRPGDSFSGERAAGSGAGSPLLAGTALQQSGSFSNASLSSTTVLYLQDIHEGDGLGQSIAGLISFDGGGNLNITAMDEDLAGTITADQPSQGTYSVEENGAVTFTCGSGVCPAGFLVGQNLGFFVGTGASSLFGRMQPQSGGPFSNASLSGTYAGGSLTPLAYANTTNEVYVGSADGVGTLALSGDTSSSNGVQPSSDVVNYSIAGSGRGTGQSQESGSASVVYMISPTEWVVLEPTTDARIDLYEH